MKKVAIVQSCYIPWKGYFDLIRSMDHFVLYDAVQFTKRDWRSRNKIKTPQGPLWLSIPISVKGKYHQSILESMVSSNEWADSHWKSILYNYKKAPHFNDYCDRFNQLYIQNKQEPSLSKINLNFITAICDMLNIKTPISLSTPLKEGLDKTEQLIYQCQEVGATHYVSGPAAKNYIQQEKFQAANIELSYFEYPKYPVYPQSYGEFTHEVSVIDLLFHTGQHAMNYIAGIEHE